MSEEKHRRDEWFVASLQAHRQAMYRTALSMLRRGAEAEDAVSTATINSYARLPYLRDPKRIGPYLLRATVNACYSQLRRRKREDAALSDVIDHLATSAPETPLWIYLETLSPKVRVALQLRYGENLPLKEVCRILGLPRGTVSARISRGLRILRQEMEEQA